MAQIDEGEGDEEIPDFDKPQTIAMMAERHSVMTGNLKALEQAREEIALLESRLGIVEGSRDWHGEHWKIGLERIAELERQLATELEIQDVMCAEKEQAWEELEQAKARLEDAEAICADLLNMVREGSAIHEQGRLMYVEACRENALLDGECDAASDLINLYDLIWQWRYSKMHRRAQKAEKPAPDAWDVSWRAQYFQAETMKLRSRVKELEHDLAGTKAAFEITESFDRGEGYLSLAVERELKIKELTTELDIWKSLHEARCSENRGAQAHMKEMRDDPESYWNRCKPSMLTKIDYLKKVSVAWKGFAKSLRRQLIMLTHENNALRKRNERLKQLTGRTDWSEEGEGE